MEVFVIFLSFGLIIGSIFMGIYLMLNKTYNYKKEIIHRLKRNPDDLNERWW